MYYIFKMLYHVYTPVSSTYSMWEAKQNSKWITGRAKNYFAKLMLSTLGKQWFIDYMFGTYICSNGAASSEKCYGKFEIN